MSALLACGGPPREARRAATPPSVGSAVDAVFSGFAADDRPGCAVGVYRAGKVVFAKGYGAANLEQSRPLTPGTPFLLASVTKQFTAAAVLLLAADGRLSLSDSIRKYVPELPSYADAVSLDSLLHHTSGVRDYGLLVELSGHRGPDRVTNADILFLLSHQHSLNFAPGTGFSYSNSGYVLLSEVVARVTGRTLREFAEERIFGPLGMVTTGFKSDHGRVVLGAATSYTRSGDGYRALFANGEVQGAGNLISSIDDLAKWDANFYAPKVGGESFVVALRERGRLSDGTLLTYARGLNEVVTDGLLREEHTGGAWGFRTTFVRYPTERLSVAVLCNEASAKPDALARGVARIFLPQERSAHFEDGAGDSAQEPARLEGTYFDSTTADLRIVERSGSGLLMRYDFAPAAQDPVIVQARGRLRAGTTDYTFMADDAASVQSFVRLSPYGGEGTLFRRIFPVREPSRSALSAYAGRYTSDELQRDVEIIVHDGTLFATSFGGPPSGPPFHPLLPDVFWSNGASFTFERGADGRVVRVVVTNVATRGVILERR